MSTVAIIPARAGSKRLPNKNIKEICGKPLVEWTIDSAIESKIFDKIIVSSDSEIVLDIAKDRGVNTVQKRPSELCLDHSAASDVIAYHVEDLSDDSSICYLQPTSPLRDKIEIINSYTKFRTDNLNGLISVCELQHPSAWGFSASQNFCTFISSLSNKRSQDFEKEYRLNGAIYWFTKVAFSTFKTHLIPENVDYYVMPLQKSVDIDNEFDFIVAESLMKKILGQ